MEPETVIGIDLGTTNSEVAILSGGTPQVVREDGDAILPSCVGIDEAGNIIVGRQARNQAVAAPERTVLSIKRRMGSDERVRMGAEEYTPQEISAFILKALKERAARALGHDVHKAVITVPAYFTDAQRQATREAGRIAGLEVVRIINEPTAAALSYEKRRDGSHRILVYDLGGGTFDVSIVVIEDGVVEVLASTGDNRLGGDDFDELVARRLNAHIEDELGIDGARENRLLQARLLRAAEQAKIELSNQPYARVEEDHIASVDGEPKHLSFELSRLDLEQDLEDLLARTMQSVTMALNDAQVRPSQLDRILMVGGSTRIPRITQLLAERLGREPHGEVDPDMCVALGAAVQAGIEMGQDMQSVLVDITPYTFGTSALGELYGLPYAHQFIPLIRRNSKLPATRTEAFFTVTENQETVELKVYQGEDPDALKNVEIGSFRFSGLNRQEGGVRAGAALHIPSESGRAARGSRGGTGDGAGDPRGRRERHGPRQRGGARRLPAANRGAMGRRRSRCRRRGRTRGRRGRRRGLVGGDPGDTGAGLPGTLDSAPAEDQEEINRSDGRSSQRIEGGPRGGRRGSQGKSRRDPLLPGIAGVERCPTCGARRMEGPICHRCQTDLRQVRAIERAAAGHRKRALAALGRGRRAEAQAASNRACALHRSDDSLVVRAVVALGDGDFPLALRLWREIRRGGPETRNG